MAKQMKLVNKLMRRNKYVNKHARGNYDRRNKQEELMQDSPRAQKTMRRMQRRYDRSWGTDVIGQEPQLHYFMNAETVERFDFDPGAGTDFGIRLTLPGEMEVTKVTTTADVAASLQNKYFFLNSPSTLYYVWANVDAAGTDPAVAGRTGIEVPLVSNDSANTVAAAYAAAIDATADFGATAALNVVTITNAADGAAADASNVNTPFAIMTSTQGADFREASGMRPGDVVEFQADSALYGQYLTIVSLPDATHARLEDVASFVGPESNKKVRVLLSSVKKAYK